MRSKFKDMIFVKGGKYTPCFTDDEKKVFDLEVCRYLTTQKIWLEVMNYNPSKFEGIYKPVDSVTWWEALEFCNKLSEKYNLEPVYDLSKKGTLLINQLDGEKTSPDIADFKKTEGFRLPTEVEWEWFARGGEVAIQDGTFDKRYSGSDNLNKVAWHSSNSEKQTHNVGTKNPNQLGIYDCSGNVWEWCYDGNDCNFWRESDSKGVLYFYKSLKDGFGKIVRGGSFGEEINEFDLKDFFENLNKEILKNCYTRTYSLYHGEYNIADCRKIYRNVGFRIVRTV